MIAIIISVLIFTVYLIYVYKTQGIMPSISASYYALKYKAMFLFWTWGSAFPLIILGESGWSFFAGAFLMFVGVASNTRVPDKMVGHVHTVGAWGAIILGYAFLFSIGLWWLAAPSIIGLLYMWFKKIDNHTWWIEVLAYYTFIIGLTIKVLS